MYSIKSWLKLYAIPLFTFCCILITKTSAHAGWVQTTGYVNGNINSFAVMGANLFAATDSGVYLSSNSGTTWSSTGLSGDTVLSLAVSGPDIYAGTYDSGVYISTNEGANWSSIGSGLPNTSINALAQSGTNLFAATDSGVYLLNGSIASWNVVDAGLTNINVLCMAVVNSVLYAGTTDSGVYISTNSGSNWHSFNSGLANLSVNSLGVSGSNIFAGTGSGAYFFNGSGNWNPANIGMPNTTINSFTFSGANIFAATDSGIYLSTNNGTNWLDVNAGLTDTDIASLIIFGANIYAGTGAVPSSVGEGAWLSPLSGFPIISPLDSIAESNIVMFETDGIVFDTVIIYNPGNATLLFNGVVSPDYSLTAIAPDSIPAGDSSMLIISLNKASQYIGTAYLFVSTNDIANPTDSISITIEAPIPVVSSDSIIIDVTTYPATYNGTTTITNTGNATFDIYSIQSTNPLIGVKAPDSIVSGSMGSIMISYTDSTVQYGTSYLFVATNNPWNPVDTISVIIEAPVAGISENTIVDNVTDRPGTYSDTVAIENSGNVSLLIDGVQSTNPLITATAPDSLTAGNSGAIIVTFNNSMLQKGTAYLYMTTNDPWNPVDTIAVTVLAPVANISVDSLVVDISTPPIVFSDTFAIMNTGNATLLVNSILSSGSAISVSAPNTVGAGDTGAVVVTFNDSLLQKGSAFLVISTNNPLTAFDTVPIFINAPVATLPVDTIVISSNTGTVTDTITISNTGNATLIIDSVVSTDSTISITSPDSVAAGDSVQIIITVTDTMQSGGNTIILITTNQPMNPVDTIKVITKEVLSVAEPEIPLSFGLSQNYPNPFNAATAISFSLPHTENVLLQVYNELGSKVEDVAFGIMDAGDHTFNFDGTNLTEGLYYYRLIADGIAQTKQMTVVK